MTIKSERDTQDALMRFAAEQQTFEIGTVAVGGQPGVRPTVLIGSIFYHGHDVVVDEERGVVDPSEAEARIGLQAEFSERTGNPAMLDVVGANAEAIVKLLEFTSAHSDMPLLVDGTTSDVRLAGIRYMAEAGMADRCVVNSIQPGVSDEELSAIEETGVSAAILLAYFLEDFSAAGRVQSVRDLVPRLRDAGIEKIMVDTCVLDLASLGQAWSAMHDIKHELGLPVGGGVHNAVATWKGLKKKMGKPAVKPCVAAVSASAAALGADFVLYGPIEDAPFVFPAVAMVDTGLSQVMIERGIRPDKSHPRFRIG